MSHLELVGPNHIDEAAELLAALAPWLRSGVVPDCPALLGRLVPGLPPPAELASTIDTLVNAGRLRRVLIGGQAHLALSETARSPATAASRDFDDELALDIESERIVLYRVTLVVLTLVALALLRQALWMGWG